ncbi:MAG TPA: peptidase T [Anaeromyxobacter sp.]|nr:peptidase T [Anaeromyxobacter sp.]
MLKTPVPETPLKRFLRYAAIDTQSKEDVETVPSTAKQLVLARLLCQELREMGARDARVDGHGYVLASIPSNLPAGHPARGRVPHVGLLAHMDTSPSAPGANVRPRLVTYRGGDVRLKHGVVIRARENPELRRNKGKKIVTTDGTTLLGADDKAGVAIIMSLASELLRGSSVPHGEVRICFTPDEEVGNGTKFLDLKAFGAQVAYTLDGDSPGELNRETFSADSATITVHGRNIHPGTAKGVMVNALRALGDILVRLPRDMSPEATEGREPFIHPHQAQGEEAMATLRLLLRDFETPGLGRQQRILERIVREVQKLNPKARIELTVKESYRNMREGIAREPRVTEALEEATKRAGLTPRWVPIRGGTDGSRLTAMGLPTPNIFGGGQNFHGPTEWLSVEGMERSLATVRNLLAVWVELSIPGASRGARESRRRARAPAGRR